MDKKHFLAVAKRASKKTGSNSLWIEGWWMGALDDYLREIQEVYAGEIERFKNAKTQRPIS